MKIPIIVGLMLIIGLHSAPKSIESCNDLADYGRHEEAIVCFTEAINSGGLSELDLAMRFHDRGISYAILGRYDHAIEDFSQAIVIFPAYAQAYFSRGRVYSDKGEHENAVSDYTRSIEFDPDNPLPYSSRGISYGELGELDRALSDFSKTIELEPSYVFAYCNRGKLYDMQGEYEKAIEDYSHAIELDPELAIAYSNRSVAYKHTGNYEKAIADCDQAIKLRPGYYNGYINRGEAYRELGMHLRAISDYDTAIMIKPDEARVYSYRGESNLALGYTDIAISDYEKAIETDPDDEYIRLWYVILCWNISEAKYDKSIGELNAYVAGNISDEWVRTISEFYLGRIGEAELLAKAKEGSSDTETNERLCEAYYYLGEEQLRNGDLVGAIDFFKKSVQTNVRNFYEYNSSRTMLRKLSVEK